MILSNPNAAALVELQSELEACSDPEAAVERVANSHAIGDPPSGLAVRSRFKGPRRTIELVWDSRLT